MTLRNGSFCNFILERFESLRFFCQCRKHITQAIKNDVKNSSSENNHYQKNSQVCPKIIIHKISTSYLRDYHSNPSPATYIKKLQSPQKH